MSTSRSSLGENWLLVDWKSGGRDVVYVRSVVSPVNRETMKAGDSLRLNRRGEQEQATLVARARERDILDAMIKKEIPAPPEGGTPEEEGQDFSSSASDWVPSDDSRPSGDSGEVNVNNIKLERYKRQYSNTKSSKKVITPSNKANAVLNMINRKRPHNGIPINTRSIKNKLLPDSTKKNQNVVQKVNIDVRELLNINNSFKMLFKMLEDMKGPMNKIMNETPKGHGVLSEFKVNETMHHSYSQLQSMDEDKENDDDISENDEFNRSDDNVLISNKYNSVNGKNVQTENAGEKEWIPIGSGKTLIHKDKFKKINWKSYTVATRTLLLAVFPRRILATHSMTGKRSPAFQDKPAKMCLDPKITSDVIMEIMDRFNVRENLVRSIITTKCADECKMLKMRANKKKPQSKHKGNEMAMQR